jgi:hypothetical protein
MGNFLFHSFENVYATDLCPWYIYPMMAGFRRTFFPGGVPPLLLLSLRAKSLRACFSFPSFIDTQPLLWQKQGLCIIFQKSTGHIFQSSESIRKRAFKNHTCSGVLQATSLLGRTSPCEEIPIYAGNRDSPFRRFRYYFVTL